MLLHLGQDTVVNTKDIVAICDLDTSTVSHKTRDFLSTATKKGQVINVSMELPKSFVIVEIKGETTVYISQLSSQTLMKRAESNVKEGLYES